MSLPRRRPPRRPYNLANRHCRRRDTTRRVQHGPEVTETARRPPDRGSRGERLRMRTRTAGAHQPSRNRPCLTTRATHVSALTGPGSRRAERRPTSHTNMRGAPARPRQARAAASDSTAGDRVAARGSSAPSGRSTLRRVLAKRRRREQRSSARRPHPYTARRGPAADLVSPRAPRQIARLGPLAQPVRAADS